MKCKTSKITHSNVKKKMNLDDDIFYTFAKEIYCRAVVVHTGLMYSCVHTHTHKKCNIARHQQLPIMNINKKKTCIGGKINTLALGLRLPIASALKSFLFFLHSTAVMMMIMRVTTAMGASTAAIIQRLLGGLLTTAGRGR